MNLAFPPELHQVNGDLFPIRDYCCQQPMISNVWAEFGVAGGNSARQILEHLPGDGTLYLFDHFKGLPEPWVHSSKYGEDDQWARQGKPEFDDHRVIIKEGVFAETLPLDDLLGFVHIDCDLYSSTKTVLENINIAPGTIILFDELYGYGGWEDHEYKALMESGIEFEYLARDSQTRVAIKVMGIT